MHERLEQFRKAHASRRGYDLAKTLSPDTSPDHVSSLLAFYTPSDRKNNQNDLKYEILYSKETPTNLSTEEGTGWVEVYHSYWKAVGEILSIEGELGPGNKVRNLAKYQHLHSLPRPAILPESTASLLHVS